MIISAVYLLVLAVILALGFLAQANPKSRITRTGTLLTRPDPVFAFVAAATLIIVAGLRYRVGTDYMAYYRTRVTDWQTVWEYLIHFREPGIRLLSRISTMIADDGAVLIFLSAMIIIGIYSLMIYRYSPMYLVSMLLFLFLGDWTGSFNGIRQYLAAAIVFAGHRYILRRKWAPYFLMVLLASLFHKSALVMVLPYFLFSRKPDGTQFVILAAGALIIRLSYEGVMQLVELFKGTIIDWNDAYMTRDVNPLRIAVSFIPVALFFSSCDRKKMGKTQEFYINGLFFNAFAMLASMGSAYFGRIGIYTGAMTCIGYGYLFQLIPKGKHKNIVITVLFIVLVAYWIYSLQSDSLHSFNWVFNR